MYALKFLLRAESPRDYVDILLSLQHQPTVTLVDMAHMVAAHGNARISGMFQPHQGRVAEATASNVQAAREHSLSIPMPWLHRSCFMTQEQVQVADDHNYVTTTHPITGVSARYCLFDKLHEGNTTKEIEVLRKTKYVPELNGMINTESEEQLHNALGRDRYFMNNMSAVRHIFLFRSNIDHRNIRLNKAATERLQKELVCSTTIDALGRAVAEGLYHTLSYHA